MKRDIDLSRELLFHIEKEFDPAEGVLQFARDDVPKDILNDHTPAEVMHHLELLWDAGLINVQLSDERDDLQRVVGGMPTVIAVRGLTHEGHDFLDNVREDKVWNQIKEGTRSLALDVVKAAAEGAAKGAIGIGR